MDAFGSGSDPSVKNPGGFLTNQLVNALLENPQETPYVATLTVHPLCLIVFFSVSSVSNGVSMPN